jgi:cystathionine beta-lyase/cystathionine gamma-synthase
LKVNILKKNITRTTRLLKDKAHSKRAVAPPIYQTSLFSFEKYSDLEESFCGIGDHEIYSRVRNPTVSLFEEKVAELEGGEAAAAFACGMGAISGVIMELAEQGDRIVTVKHTYPDAYRFMKQLCKKFGMTTEFVDGTDLDAIEKSIQGAKLLYLESPGSFMMEEQNLAAIATLAKKHGVITIIDNSWSTPFLQNPIELGIDVVIHSASKYISGHSDVVAGIAVSRQELITEIKRNSTALLGAKLSAHEAGLLLRGLRTLPVRLKQHQESALIIIDKLVRHPAVAKVYHPYVDKKDFSTLKGYSSLLSIDLADDIDVIKFCDAFEIFHIGVSWGGYESLVLPALASIKRGGEFNSAVDFNLSPQCVRLFIGLEDVNDLWSDIENALEKAKKA